MREHSSAARILVVDDDRAFRVSTAELLRQDGHTVDVAEDAKEAAEALEGTDFDLLLLDLRMPGLDGVRFLEVLRMRGSRVPVLMISGFGTIDSAVEALQIGAEDFLTKPVDPDDLTAKVREILERRPQPSGADESFGIVGRSPVMREVFDAIERVAPSETTVLIAGETGTGKELVARALHERSERSTGPFVPVNCASLSEGVLESELFGHVRGAFTGAESDKTGLFEAANGGTLFLDEVGDMSLRLQQRLLRVLQEREVLPVGATKPVEVSGRVIAATHRDLAEEVEGGRFREDLFYRLRVFSIELPPLRKRSGDVPVLVEAALERLRGRAPDRTPDSCSTFAMKLLTRYAWPGNVRELFAVIESAAIRADGRRIEAHHLPEEVRRTKGIADPEAGARTRHRAPSATPEDERSEIEAALQEAGGMREKAAQLLGMSRTTLWRRMKELGLE